MQIYMELCKLARRNLLCSTMLMASSVCLLLCNPEHTVTMKHAKSFRSSCLLRISWATQAIFFSYPNSEVSHQQEMVLSFDPYIATLYSLPPKALRTSSTNICILKIYPLLYSSRFLSFSFIDLHNIFSLQQMSVLHNFKTLDEVIKTTKLLL